MGISSHGGQIIDNKSARGIFRVYLNAVKQVEEDSSFLDTNKAPSIISNDQIMLHTPGGVDGFRADRDGVAIGWKPSSDALRRMSPGKLAAEITIKGLRVERHG